MPKSLRLGTELEKTLDRYCTETGKTGVMEVFTIDRRDFEVYRTRTGRRFRLVAT